MAHCQEVLTEGMGLTYGSPMDHSEKDHVRSFTREELAEELVTLGDIAAMLGRPYDTVSKWRDRHQTFPKPVAQTLRAAIYLRSEIWKWLEETGRVTEGVRPSKR